MVRPLLLELAPVLNSWTARFRWLHTVITLISKYTWKTFVRGRPNNACMARQNINAFLGKIIRQHRRSKKLSQEALAFAAGITRNYVSMIELAENSPTVETLDAIADALHTSGAVLLAEAEALRQPHRSKR